MRRILPVLLALSACATAAPVTTTASAMDPNATAKPPFAAAQIRDATRPGRVYRLSVEAEGETAYFRQMEFIAVTEDGCTMRSSMFDFDGNIKGAPVVSDLTWKDLEGHATYPLARTTITDATTDTPAGSFETWLYTVTEANTITRAYFAKGLPGAPVRFEQEEDGVVIYTQTLVEYREP